MKLKKIIFSFIFAFLSIACVTGSVFLLQGCSQSTPKDGGGGLRTLLKIQKRQKILMMKMLIQIGQRHTTLR